MAATCFSKAIVGLASQIASWQPALRGLYYSEWAVVLLFLCMDYQLLGRYTRSALNASQREHYGSVRIVGHYLAAVATLTVGALAMILQVGCNSSNCCASWSPASASMITWQSLPIAGRHVCLLACGS
jgi:hypothetical protein